MIAVVAEPNLNDLSARFRLQSGALRHAVTSRKEVKVSRNWWMVPLGLLVVAGCGGGAVIDPGDGGEYAPVIDPSRFVEVIDNPFLPLTVGSRWVYEGESDGQVERVEVVVTEETRMVMGVNTVVVRDTVSVDGEVVEDTFDWFAQDADGNVWYFGEDVSDFENGVLVSRAGSWEAGVDGALPGIVMPADPVVGAAYRQEFLAGEAEDMAEVKAVGGTATVPFGTFDDVVTTHDWTPLEPDVVEEKLYAAGIGNISSDKIEGGEGGVVLMEYTPGP
jgi:hypothetical protein